MFPVDFEGQTLRPSERSVGKPRTGMQRLKLAGRLSSTGKACTMFGIFKTSRRFRRQCLGDTGIAGFASEKRYVVETSEKVVQAMFADGTDPGDLVLDPTLVRARLPLLLNNGDAAGSH